MKNNKRVVFVHGWHGSSKEGWFPWLKENLELKGFEVISSDFPGQGHPKLEEWLDQLAKDCGNLNKDLFFVGHSLGCVSIVRFLEGIEGGQRIGGAVFVAPFLRKLRFNEIDEFTENIISVEKARLHLIKSISIISEDDDAVPLDIAKDFAIRMNSEIFMDNGKGHFGQRSGIKELPSALDAILRISSS